MEKSNIREPKQRRSIEKKNKIIEAGYLLFCEKGFYNTNTVEISEKAGISVGTVYSYFEDKKAIFLEVLKYYSEKILMPMYAEFETLSKPLDLHEIISKIIDISVQTHMFSEAAHEEMLAMSHSDKDVKKLTHDFEEQVVLKFAEILCELGINIENVNEKIHIIYNAVEFYSHEAAFHKHNFINYDVMREEIIKMIIKIISDDTILDHS